MNLFQNEEFQGVFIPRELYCAKNLTWIEKILLVEINSLDGKNGCSASNKYLAKFLGVSEKRISNGISKLKRLKLVKQIAFNGRERSLKTYYKNLN